MFRPSKTDSAPVRGNSYKPRSSKFRLRANAETSHSVLVGLVVVVSVMGHSKKFLYRIVRSRKPLLMVPLHNTATTIPLLGTYTIQHRCAVFNNIPQPPVKSINDLILINERAQMNK